VSTRAIPGALAAAGCTAATAGSWRETLRLLYGVFKLRIGIAIALCAVAGAAIAGGPAMEAWRVAAVALCVLLSSAAAGAFNHLAEQDLDARMRRTRRRPFVTGRFVAGGRWYAAVGALLLASVVGASLAGNAASAAYTFLGAFTYGVVYTVWLKRRSWTNIVIGGLAGSFAVLAGAAAVDPALGPAPVLLALVLFLWTPPHFWSLAFVFREDYAAAGVPMLPVVVDARTAARIVLAHVLALVAISLVPVLYGLGAVYLAGALVGGAWFVATSLWFLREPSRERAMGNFRASLAQLTLLLVAAVADGLFAT